MERALTPRALRTRDKLVTAARFVFERDGFALAKITDIAKRAKVAVGSFYTYFDSKDAIFRAVIHEVGRELAAPLPRPREGRADPLARIEAGNRAYVHTYAKNARILAVMQHRIFEDRAVYALRQQGRQLFVDRAERAIRRLQKSGQLAATTRPRFAALALAGMVHAFCYETFALGGEGAVSEEEAIQGLTALWAGALGLQPTATRKAS